MFYFPCLLVRKAYKNNMKLRPYSSVSQLAPAVPPAPVLLEMKSASPKTKTISYPVRSRKYILRKDDCLKRGNFTFLVSKTVGYKKGGVSIFGPLMLRKDVFRPFYLTNYCPAA